jgi:hypothetical protein
MKYSDLVSIAAAASLALAMGAAPAAARGGPNKVKPAAAAKAKPVKPAATAKAKPVKPSNSAAGKTNATAANTTKSKPLGSASTAAASSKPTPTAKRAKGENRMQSSTESQDGRPLPSTTILPEGKAVDKLANNANLREKMQSRLPRGTDVMAAAGGFKNLGQFVAAVNVSNNLGIEFTVLKRLMVGQGYSLGQAIQQAKAMDAGQAVRLGNAAVIQANTEIAKPSTTSPPTTSVTPRGRPGNATVIPANSAKPSTTSPPTTSPRRRPGNATVVQANSDKPPTTSRKVKD